MLGLPPLDAAATALGRRAPSASPLRAADGAREAPRAADRCGPERDRAARLRGRLDRGHRPHRGGDAAGHLRPLPQPRPAPAGGDRARGALRARAARAGRPGARRDTDGEPAELFAAGVRSFLDVVASRPDTWRIILLPPEGTPGDRPRARRAQPCPHPGADRGPRALGDRALGNPRGPRRRAVRPRDPQPQRGGGADGADRPRDATRPSATSGSCSP